MALALVELIERAIRFPKMIELHMSNSLIQLFSVMAVAEQNGGGSSMPVVGTERVKLIIIKYEYPSNKLHSNHIWLLIIVKITFLTMVVRRYFFLMSELHFNLQSS